MEEILEMLVTFKSIVVLCYFIVATENILYLWCSSDAEFFVCTKYSYLSKILLCLTPAFNMKELYNNGIIIDFNLISFFFVNVYNFPFGAFS